MIVANKPSHLPAVYSYADKFFSEVEPRLDSLLSKYKRRLTLAQTVGSTYHQFQPFLLDFPAIRKLLAKSTLKDEGFWLHFWHEVDAISVHRQFREAEPKLKKVFENSKRSIVSADDFKARCTEQEIAQTTLLARIPSLLDNKILEEAFPCRDAFGRANRISQMQKFCNSIKNSSLSDNLVIDMYNLTVYKNSFAFHIYKRVGLIVEQAREHALGLITIVVPDENYIFRQWYEIMRWYAVNERISEVCKEMFGEDAEAHKFLMTVFCLRDLELEKQAVAIKQKLVRSFLSDRNAGKALLRSVVEEYPFAAPYWIRHEMKNKPL